MPVSPWQGLPHVGYALPRGKGYAAATVLGGLLLFGLAIYSFRAPPPPEAVVVEKPVAVVRYVEKPVAPPVVRAEPPAPVLAAPQAPEPPPPVTARIEPEIPAPLGPWDGVWRIVGREPLPLFKLKRTGETLSGEYAPSNYTGTYPFAGGKVVDEVAEFAVTDPVGQRIHFRMRLWDNGDARVEKWVTAEDVLRSLQIAGRGVRTLPQARDNQMKFRGELPRAGKVIPVGTFRRVPDPGRAEP